MQGKLFKYILIRERHLRCTVDLKHYFPRLKKSSQNIVFMIQLSDMAGKAQFRADN